MHASVNTVVHLQTDPQRGESTHYDIEQPRDMSVGETLQDLYLALEVVEELGTEATPVHCLDRNLVVCLLCVISMRTGGGRHALVVRTSWYPR